MSWSFAGTLPLGSPIAVCTALYGDGIRGIALLRSVESFRLGVELAAVIR